MAVLGDTQLDAGVEHVVLVDGRGRPRGTAPKATIHDSATPLHEAFSCYVVRDDGMVLLTQRALTKRTWPGVWTNSCCGHPQAGEPLSCAVARRLDDELGLRLERFEVVVPDFAYRAVMEDGTVEHELCPVSVATIAGTPCPDPTEVEDAVWIPWDELVERARAAPERLSPWSVEQILELAGRGWSPRAWLASPPSGGAGTGRSAISAPAVDGARAIAAPVDRLLAGFLAEKRATLHDLAPGTAALADELADLMAAGGKRLRAAFVHWGHAAVHDPRTDGEPAESPDAAVVHAGAAMELLHAFALVHDDVMDRSAERRGRPAAHAAFAAEHRTSGRDGDAAWFGMSCAVLAGDLAHVWADELLDAAPVVAAARSRARSVFTGLREEVIAGQHLDLVHAGDAAADESTAVRVALLKSARYTVTRPLLLGAALAPAAPDPGVHDALVRYGDATGLAFQLRDDVLGMFGDPAETGKSAADDLREGKRTLLVLRALRLADEPGRAVISAALGDPDLDDEQAAAVRAAVTASGALASVERRIAAEHATAVAALAAVPEPARSALAALASASVRRSS